MVKQLSTVRNTQRNSYIKKRRVRKGTEVTKKIKGGNKKRDRTSQQSVL